MLFKYITIVLLLLSAGCVSSRKLIVPTFTVNDKKYNHLIVNRIPVYGLTERDGCLVQGEFHLTLKTFESNQAIGTVKDVLQKEPLPNTIVSLYLDMTSKPDRVITDQHGQFQIPDLKEVKKIEISHVGFRNYTVLIKRKKSLKGF